jgi:hypothetical protein
MLLISIAALAGWTINLRERTAQRTPWLACGAHDLEELEELADAVHDLPMTSAALVKAFDPRNDADAFVVPTPLLLWACECDTCGQIFEPDTSLRTAAALSAAPISAKLAVAAKQSFAAPGLQHFLGALETESGRQVLDVDAYLTSASSQQTTTSASLGWHIDDLDVLLVMLRGRK